MKLPRRNFLHLASGAAALPVMQCLAWAQAYPTRTVNIIFAFPPGGPSEGVVRLLAEKLSLSLGRPVVIENRPGGAGGSVGTRSVASASPDGHTLLLSTHGPLVVAPLIYKNIGYDPIKEFTPIATLISIPQMLVVHPAVPVKSIHDLVAYAKANPGKISFPSPGYGTQPHLLGEMFKLMTGVDIIHIPTRAQRLQLRICWQGKSRCTSKTSVHCFHISKREN